MGRDGIIKRWWYGDKLFVVVWKAVQKFKAKNIPCFWFGQHDWEVGKDSYETWGQIDDYGLMELGRSSKTRKQCKKCLTRADV
jgi:hypothetical protein